MDKLFKNISFSQMDEMNLEGFAMIDIRSSDAYKEGHIKGFINVTNNSAKNFIDSTSKETSIIVCCYHGQSSQNFSQSLCQIGYKNVYSLDGGYEGWKSRYGCHE